MSALEGRRTVFDPSIAKILKVFQIRQLLQTKKFQLYKIPLKLCPFAFPLKNLPTAKMVAIATKFAVVNKNLL